MPTSGTVERDRGRGPHDHVCLVYRDGAELIDVGRRFLDDGRARGLQVRYVGGPAGLPLRDAFGTGRDRGDPDATYPVDVAVEPAVQVRVYAEATAAALAAGFAGLRVVAEVTSMVATPARRSAFARYEHLVDRYMTAHPFSALCAYDRTRIGADAAAELACMHPTAAGGAAPFRLYAAPGVAAVLAGEVDRISERLFADALDRADLPVVAGEIVIDASGLEFIDHHGMLVLDALAHRAGAAVVLRTHRHLPRRLADLLGLDAVRVEPPR